MNSANASIRWLTTYEGGRESTPLQRHHVLVSRFADLVGEWPHKAWSLVIDFSEPPRNDVSVRATLRFLSNQFADPEYTVSFLDDVYLS